jgi:hypothetical protein
VTGMGVLFDVSLSEKRSVTVFKRWLLPVVGGPVERDEQTAVGAGGGEACCMGPLLGVRGT